MEPGIMKTRNRQEQRRTVSPRGAVLLAAFGIGGALSVSLGAGASAPSKKTPPLTPETRLTFEALGIPSLSVAFLGQGASMLTVNFVDDRHLLVTFGSRGLVPRSRDGAEGDQDRLVKAELVSLPAGKVLSHTEWHLHDHGRYLWPLGGGRFLLRMRQDLSTFAPLANLEAHDPWARTAFAHRRGILTAVELSADDRVVALMSTPPKRAVQIETTQPARSMNVTGGGDVVDRTADFVNIDFYRITGKGTEASPLQMEHAGTVRSPEAIRLPLDGDGYLRSQSGRRGMWKVSFEGYEGATRALAPLGSGCPPVLTLTSRAQLLAFTCRGISPGSITMQAYDFAGHEMWEEPIGEVPTTPSFVYAPQAGRFAMSRLLPVASGPQVGAAEMPSGPAQELRVYQMQSGDLLLKANVTPTFRTAENYDLSADGMHAVVVHAGELDVYRLPELNKEDREDLEDVARMEPATAGAGPINLRRLVEDDAQPAPLKNAEGTVAAVPGTAAVAAAAKVAETDGSPAAGAKTSQTIANGDSQEARKPPTLLNPGESAEYKAKGTPK